MFAKIEKKQRATMAQGESSEAIGKYRESLNELSSIEERHASERERASQVSRELHDARAAHERAVGERDAVIKQFAAGSATSTDVSRAQEEANAAGKTKEYLEELVTVCQRLIAEQPGALDAAQTRANTSRLMFRQQVYVATRQAAPPGVGDWLVRTIVAQRSAFGTADLRGLVIELLRDADVEWRDALPLPRQADVQKSLEEQALNESEG